MRRRSVSRTQREFTHELLEAHERQKVLGGAARDEARTVAVSPERDRQGPEEPAGEPVEKGEREPGEVGTTRHQQEPGGAGAKHGRRAPGGRVVDTLEDGVERRAPRGADAGQSKSIHG